MDLKDKIVQHYDAISLSSCRLAARKAALAGKYNGVGKRAD
jgi:hypothetical protein